MEICYIAGYNTHNLPADIKQGLVSHIIQMYEQPEKVTALHDLHHVYQKHRIINI